ncbi:AI-2E family transporter [Brachybacterium sp. JB7]|uniref:AI-2E family transporter n=1 Tax=Brachybacterium TaxID=43668 RepID=UPI000DF192FA|nr:AI-2E family transporter [Brachybacterium sp. JB7]RCS64543.1 AI-2E family transporter [Brachybacterium sp. JB7]
MSKLSPTSRAPSLAPEVEEIPLGVRRLASWSWRIIVIVAAAALLLWGLLQVTTIVIPVLLAVLLACLLTPVVKLLTRYTFLGRTAASGIALLGLLLVISGMFTLAGRQLITQLADIQDKAVTGFQSVMTWATTTFQIDAPMIDSAIDEGLAKLQDNADTVLNSAVSTAAVLGNLATGVVVLLFTLFFLLSSGSSIWSWTVGLLPPAARVPTHEAFRRGWKALSAYVRTQILVAAVDATGIAIGMVFLGLGSYAVPIWLLVFLFSFVPLVGAIASGAIAILIVLVLQNWIFALIMLGIVLVVQQLESNILQPILMGKAVELHPLAVFLGVAGGAMIAGIPGALFAIPLIAFVNATLLYLVGRDSSPELGVDTIAADHFASLGGNRPAHVTAGADASDDGDASEGTAASDAPGASEGAAASDDAGASDDASTSQGVQTAPAPLPAGAREGLAAEGATAPLQGRRRSDGADGTGREDGADGADRPAGTGDGQAPAQDRQSPSSPSDQDSADGR